MDEALAAEKSRGDSSSVALRVIAGLLVVGAAWLMAHLLVPFVLALVLAIALSPVANWLERWRFPRTLAALVCMLAVALVIVAGVGLIVYEAGEVAQDADRYVRRFGAMVQSVAERFSH